MPPPRTSCTPGRPRPAPARRRPAPAPRHRVKDVVAAAAAAQGVAPPPRYTSLVAALGLVWSCYQRAAKPRGDDSDSSGLGPTCLSFPVDHRSRLRPPLPAKYFGYYVGGALAIASRSELAEDAGGLLTACAAVAAGIEDALSGGGATETMGVLIERFRDG
ncbi:hypothetical protein EJB05_29283, partial [Eragrostis curvula]